MSCPFAMQGSVTVPVAHVVRCLTGLRKREVVVGAADGH